FHPYVQAGAKRLDGECRVLAGADADEHGVESAGGDHFGEAAVAARDAVFAGGARELPGVKIAERLEFHRQVVKRRQDVAVAVGTDADDAEAQVMGELALIAHWRKGKRACKNPMSRSVTSPAS